MPEKLEKIELLSTEGGKAIGSLVWGKIRNLV